MGEAYDYFAGVNAYAGTNKIKADYTRVFISGTIAGPTYVSPPPMSCQKNFIIVINNGPFSRQSARTPRTAMSSLGAGGRRHGGHQPSRHGEQQQRGRRMGAVPQQGADRPGDDLHARGRPVNEWQGPYNTALLQSIGRQGKGGYFSAADAATLNAALTRIFNDIQAVNSVFASSSLPLSADNSGVFSDQVYMGGVPARRQRSAQVAGQPQAIQVRGRQQQQLFLVDASGVAAAARRDLRYRTRRVSGRARTPPTRRMPPRRPPPAPPRAAPAASGSSTPRAPA